MDAGACRESKAGQAVLHSGSSTKSLPGALALGPNPAFQGALLTQLSQAPGKVVSWFQ